MLYSYMDPLGSHTDSYPNQRGQLAMDEMMPHNHSQNFNMLHLTRLPPETSMNVDDISG